MFEFEINDHSSHDKYVYSEDSGRFWVKKRYSKYNYATTNIVNSTGFWEITKYDDKNNITFIKSAGSRPLFNILYENER